MGGGLGLRFYLISIVLACLEIRDRMHIELISKLTTKQASNLTRVRGDRNIGTFIVTHDVVENSFGAGILVSLWLGLQSSPVRIVFSKLLLKLEAGEVFPDVGLAMAAIASMRAYSFAQEFFDDRHKRSIAR